MIRFGLLIMLISIFCWGCKTKKNPSTKSKEATEKVQNNTSTTSCIDEENGLVWSENTDKIAKKFALEVATNYKLFEVNELNLRQMIERNSKSRNEPIRFGFPIYVNGKVECKFFNLVNSETIAQSTQERMRIYTFKGEDLSNPLHTGRFDYELNRGLRAYLQLDQQTYVFEPIVVGGGRYYISYNKKDTEAIKKQFDVN